MIKLLVVRHSQTGAEEQSRTLGQIDWKLSQNGVQEAQKYALELKQSFPLIHKVYSSPLLRARETASIIAAKYYLDVNFDPLLQERDFGELSGLTWEEFVTKFPELATINQPNFQPNLRGGESIPEVEVRVQKFLAYLRQSHQSEIENNQDTFILLITHSGIIRILKRILTDLTPEESRANDTSNLELSIFNLENI